MKTIIQKFTVNGSNLRYLYVINNVNVGLELALRNKIIRQHQPLFDEFKALEIELKKIRMPLNEKDIRMVDQIEAKKLADIGLWLLDYYLGQKRIHGNTQT